MSSVIKLKKSSVAGRVPSDSDLQYGELALNFADGVLYFKNSSNTIQSFKAGSFLDSAAAIAIVDSSYVQARQTDPGLDSAQVNSLIDDASKNTFSRIIVPGQFDVVADSTQDGLTYAEGNNVTITTTPNDDTVTFSTTALSQDSVISVIDSNYIDVRLPTRMVTLTDSQELTNKTLTAPIFGDSSNSPYFTEIRFNNSNIMKFNQMYTGASNGSYFTNGEYQKVVTITPDGDAQNYQVVGRITAQNASDIHTVYFNAGLRSGTLPDLSWSIRYYEEYNGSRYLDPQLWTKETATAGFIFAFKTLATIYGTVTVDFEVIPRTKGQLDNVTVNDVQNSEQTTVDTGFTARDMTRTHAIIGDNVRLGAYTFPTADGSANQVLGTNGSGTLQFVNQTEGLDSGSAIALIDSAYIQARQVDVQRDSAFVSGIVDSSYVLARAPAQDFLDSSEAINLIDSAYVQARQSNGYSAGTVDAILVDGNSFTDTTYEDVFWTAGSDSSGSGYNQGGGLTWQSSDGRVTVSSGGLYEIKFHAYLTASGDGANHNHRFHLWINGTQKIAAFVHKYMETSETSVQVGTATLPLNASDYIQIRGANGSAWKPRVYGGAGHTYLQVIKQENGVLDTGIDSSTITSLSIDSTGVTNLIDSAYVLARAPAQDFLDSAEALALIDSDYVFSRVSETNYTYQLGTDADSNNNAGLNYLSTSTSGHGVAIQPDGSQLFIGNSREVRVWDTPTTTWDVSTYNRQSSYDKDFTTDIGSSNITDFGFNDDGTRMYIINGGSVIRQFDLSTAYRPSTASYTSTDYYNPTDVGNLNGFGFSDDGTKLILSSGNITSTLGTNADGVRSYTLSTAWDVTTATYDNKEIITGYRGDDYERIPMSSYFANNGKDFFIYGQQQRRVQHFPLATAYDITSYTTRNQLDQMHNSGSYSNAVEIVFDQNLYIAVGNSNLGSVGFSSTGTYVGFNNLVRNLIDSDYVIARAPAAGLDSSSTIALIDSSYVQARQSSTDLTNYRTVTQIQSMIDSDVNALVDGAPGALNTLNELAAALNDDSDAYNTLLSSINALPDSAQVATIVTSYGYSTYDSGNTTGIVDSAYVQLRQTAQDFAYGSLTGVPSTFAPDGVDSAATIALIDSAYVSARAGSAGLDSAAVKNMIDSNYILARDGVNDSDTLFTDKARFFDFTADSGQTSFTGVKYTPGKQQVYLNGVLLVDSADYTATTGSTIVLTQGADSGNTLSVIGYETLPVGAATTITTFNYEADSGQTTFSGTADNGGTLEYTAGKLNVYLNGVLLVDSADYTATNGTSVVLNTAADSGNQLSIISYITSQVGTLDSSGVTNLIDSAYVQARQSASSSFDSSSAIGLIDSAYVQARQVDLQRDSGFVTAIIDSAYVLARAPAQDFLDSAEAINLIDSAYVQARQSTSSAFDSGNATGLIDSAYVQARQSTSSAFDSGNAIGLIDSAYIQARQVDLQRDSAFITGLIDSAYIQARDRYRDSNFVTALVDSAYIQLRDRFQDSSGVTAIIDSAYVQARQSASGIDSAAVLNLIDSAYILARDGLNDSSSLFTDKVRFFDFTADSGQTSFTGVKYTPGKQQVYLNGVLLVDSADYTATTGSTIVLTTAADSGNTLSVIGYETLPTAAATTITTFNFEADSGQTTFSGTADNGGTLEYTSGKLNVYLNGVLLVDSADYTATNGTSVVLNTAADSGNQLSIISYITTSVGTLDSSGVTNLIDSAYIQARQVDLQRDSGFVTNIIDSAYVQLRQSASSSFDSNNAIGLIDSAYVLARAPAQDFLDSSEAINLIDSAYVQLRQTAQDFAYSSLTGVPSTFAPAGVDSSATTALIDSAYIQARQVDLQRDSGFVTNIIDSAYVLARAPAQDFLDSAEALALIDSSYVAARTGNNSLTVNFRPDRKYARLTMSSNQTGITTTEALTTFNTRDVDTSPNNALTSTLSDGKFIIPAGVTKVQLRASVKTSSVTDQVTMDIRKNGSQITGSTNLDISSTGRDHAAGYTGIIDVVENDYFQIFMFSQNSRTAEQDEYSWFEIEVIEGSMLNTAVASTIELSNLSNVDSASPSDGQALVWDSANNYWKPSTIAASGFDSGNATGLIDSSYIQARQSTVSSAATTITTTTFEADSGDTTFTTSYTVGKINVYLNGILLVDSADYTASNGTSVVLTQAADSADQIQIIKYTTVAVGTLDSSGVTNLIDSAYVQARQSASSAFDSGNATGLIDSAYVQARQSASSAFDSNNAIGLIDSAYVLARAPAQDFLDSSEAINLIDSSYVQARQSSTDLTNYRTVTQIQTMIDSEVNSVIDAAPGALNTLNELAAAIGDDANFSTTITNSIATKLPLAGGTMTGAIAMGSNKITGLGTPTATTDAATKAYADTMLPLAGGTMTGNIDLDNNELLNINYLRFNDPGVQEGIGWEGGNGWQIFESPDNMTNASGNLQFTTGTNTSDRMMTIDTNGNLELPTGRLTQVSDDPLRIRSSTNANTVSIEFSDIVDTYNQKGTISYTHSDAQTAAAGISGANELFTISGSETQTGIKLDGRLLVTDSAVFQGDGNFGSNKIYYANMFSTEGDLPSASTYHGMFAHVHGTGAGYFAHGGNWIRLANQSELSSYDSNSTIGIVDSAYVQARQSASSAFDSNNAIGLIDSAYVQARQTSGGGGLDSSAVTNLIDSNYVNNRSGSTAGNAVFASNTYHFTADSGQTAFSGADDNGSTMTINGEGDANVFLNGILLLETTDYTISGNTVTLTSGADSANTLSVVTYAGDTTTNIGITNFSFTASADQTTFSGLDADSATLAYDSDQLLVYLNGILLDKTDYTASNGTSIVLDSATSAGDLLNAITIAGTTRDTTKTWRAKSVDYTATANDKLFIDCSDSARTVNLPSAATLGDEVRIIDVKGNAATNNITIARNGHKINGADSDLVLDINRAAVGLVYYDTTEGWVLMER